MVSTVVQESPSIFKKLFNFYSPRLAIAAVIGLIFVLIIALIPMKEVEKMGFMLAFGGGIYYLSIASKAINNAFGNLAVLMMVCGCTMIIISIVLTPSWVFASSALEGEVAAIIGALGGMFTKVEEG